MAVVYKHTRMDNGLPFYIGIGKTIARAKSEKNRNNHWHGIVKKYGYNIEILHTNISWEEACELEKKYIKQYGRSDLGLGPLCNMTDGGDGVLNISNETRNKMSKARKGKKLSNQTKRKMSTSRKNHIVTQETRQKISEAQIGEKNHMYGKRGYNYMRKFSDETKQKMSESHLGEKHNMSKLTNDDVLFIREKYKPRDENYSTIKLSKLFNIKPCTVCNIVKRRTWTHI